MSGVALLLAAVAVLAGSELAPRPVAAPAAAREVPLPAGDAVLTCPGAPRLLTLEGEPPTDPEFGARARTVPSVTAVAAGGTAPRLTVTTTEEEVAGSRAGWLSTASTAPHGSSAVRAGQQAGHARVSALQTAVTTDGDLRGLAASPCSRPARRTWLTGGGTVVGRSVRLELANAGATTATVDVSVLTPDGRVDPPAGQDVPVVGGGTTELLVEALVPGVEALAVGVSATGGRVGASLVDTWLDGLTPKGTDVVVPGVAPAEHQVVPVAAVLPRGDAPVLRIAVPGTEDAVARWQVHGPAGQVEAEGRSARTVPAGTVVDVPLEGLEAGVHAVVVDADVPVTAAVTSTSGGAANAADRASSVSTAPLRERTLVPLPAPPVTGRLVLSAGQEPADVEVQALTPDAVPARSRRVTVPARSTLEIALADIAPRAATVLAVEPASRAGGLRAALLLTADAADGAPLVSVVPLRPAPPDPGALVVRPLPDGRWP